MSVSTAPLGGRTDNGVETGTGREGRRPPRVLLAEDTAFSEHLLVAVLSRAGCTVRVARTGREAVALFEAQTFDVVLLDIQMPDMDGIEAATAIRRLETAPRRVRILALSATIADDTRTRCAEAGIDDCLVKPVDAAVLLAHVRNEAEPGDSRSGEIDDARILRELGGDRELLGRMIEIFDVQSATLLTSVRRAIATRDCSLLEEASHSLKSVLGHWGCSKALDAARSLEARGRSGQVDGAAIDFLTLRDDVPRVREALERLRRRDTGDRPKGD